MKNKKLLRSFDLVDEKYLEEAAPTENKKKSVRSRVIKWGSIAASLLAVAVIFNVIFLKPYDDDALANIEQHADSEYYPIIEKLNELTYRPPQHKNLLQQLWRGLSNGGLKGDAVADDMMAVDNEMNMAPGASVLENGTGNYEEITDNQVNYQKLSTIDQTVRRNFVKPIDEETLENQLITGYFKGLGDKYSYYMSPQEYSAYLASSSSKTVGIGVSVGYDIENDAIAVYSVTSGSPAAQSGILAGDFIIAVEGQNVSDIGYHSAVEMTGNRVP